MHEAVHLLIREALRRRRGALLCASAPRFHVGDGLTATPAGIEKFFHVARRDDEGRWPSMARNGHGFMLCGIEHLPEAVLCVCRRHLYHAAAPLANMAIIAKISRGARSKRWASRLGCRMAGWRFRWNRRAPACHPTSSLVIHAARPRD